MCSTFNVLNIKLIQTYLLTNSRDAIASKNFIHGTIFDLKIKE